jgi:Holliday junction DNA helicase RuvA
MISKLTGQISYVGAKSIIVDVGGVGYNVFVSNNSLANIVTKDIKHISIFTYLAVRENSLELFGFEDIDELHFFELLIDISGIGPRSALTIISVAPLETLKRAIGSGDTSYLTKISGIGRKTAEKIVIELRDKLSALGHKSENGEHKEELDALEALKSLGYSQNEARDALKEVDSSITATGARIKEALKILGRK